VDLVRDAPHTFFKTVILDAEAAAGIERGAPLIFVGRKTVAHERFAGIEHPVHLRGTVGGANRIGDVDMTSSTNSVSEPPAWSECSASTSAPARGDSCVSLRYASNTSRHSAREIV
jgi:hypothetical protein